MVHRIDIAGNVGCSGGQVNPAVSHLTDGLDEIAWIAGF